MQDKVNTIFLLIIFAAHT